MIKLLLCDVDGTLTDGVYQMYEDGTISKGFYSRDFHGMYELNKTGVKIGVISLSRDKIIVEQCERAAKYVNVMIGAKNKLQVIKDEYVDKGVCEWDEIAFIGDDNVDSELLQIVGLPGCPWNADEQIKKLISRLDDGFQCTYSGGHGAVREFVDYVSLINKREV